MYSECMCEKKCPQPSRGTPRLDGDDDDDDEDNFDYDYDFE